MEKHIKVGEIMTRNFIHLSPKSTVLECAKTMIKKRVGSLIIKENDEIKGIVTEKDIIWALVKTKGEKLSEVYAKDIATKKIVSIRPDATINEALEKMNKKKVRKLPVMTNKKIIGYITVKDILKFNPSLFESINELNNIKEESRKLRTSNESNEDFIESMCEECGNYELLSKVDGRLICSSCKESM